VFLHVGHAESDPGNRTLASIPFPGDGLAVKSDLTVARAGRFSVLVLVPEHAAVLAGPARDPRAIPCDLQVSVTDPSGRRVEEKIDGLNVRGGIPSMGVLVYSASGTIDLDSGGTFELKVQSRGIPEAFVRSGAMIQLERSSPLDAGLRGPMYVAFGYTFEALALGLAVVLFFVRE
jgi:hypothetical protein